MDINNTLDICVKLFPFNFNRPVISVAGSRPLGLLGKFLILCFLILNNSFAQNGIIFVGNNDGSDYLELSNYSVNNANRAYVIFFEESTGQPFLKPTFVEDAHIKRFMGIPLINPFGEDIESKSTRKKFYKEILLDLFLQQHEKLVYQKNYEDLFDMLESILSLSSNLDELATQQGQKVMKLELTHLLKLKNLVSTKFQNPYIKKTINRLYDVSSLSGITIRLTRNGLKALSIYEACGYQAIGRMTEFEILLNNARLGGIFNDPALTEAFSEVKSRINQYFEAKTNSIYTSSVLSQIVSETLVTSFLDISFDLVGKVVVQSLNKLSKNLQLGDKLEYTMSMVNDDYTKQRELECRLVLQANIDYYILFRSNLNINPDIDLRADEVINYINEHFLNQEDRRFYLYQMKLYLSFVHLSAKHNYLNYLNGSLIKRFLVGAITSNNDYISDLSIRLKYLNGKMDLFKVKYLTLLSYIGKPTQSTFTDIPNSHWLNLYIDELVGRGIIRGYQDANGDPTWTFGPSDLLKRSELAKIVVLSTNTALTLGGTPFEDVPSNHQFFAYIQTLKNLGIVSGYPGTNQFKPDNFITRAEVAKIIVIAFGFPEGNNQSSFPDVPFNSDFNKYINSLVVRGVVTGYKDKKFRPWSNISRAEAVKIIHESISIKENWRGKER